MGKDKRILYRYHSTSLSSDDSCKRFVICNSSTNSNLDFEIDAVVGLKEFFEEYFYTGSYYGILHFGNIKSLISSNNKLCRKGIALVNNYKITSNYITIEDAKGIMKSLNYILKNYKPKGKELKESIINIVKKIKLANNKEEVI